MKKIYIDGLGLVEGHFSGIGQYILGILQGLDTIIDEAKSNQEAAPEIIVIIPRDTVGKFKSFGFKHLKYKRFPLPFRYVAGLWHRGWLPPLDLLFGKGVYIFPRFVGARLWFSKSANVIYDLSYELHREYSDEKNAIFLSKQVKNTLKSSDKVITISENSKQEIIDFYKIPAADIVVAPPATDPAVFYRRSDVEVTKVKAKYGIKGDYILALSNLEPRKNLSALVEAYCHLPKKIKAKTSLLLVGVSGWKTDKLFDEIVEKVKQGEKIIRPTQYVTDQDKPAVLSGAKMLVYPSHYEGFGMPPLEALACGTPVITADNSSLPEVVKGVGAMVDSGGDIALSDEIVTYFENMESVTARALTAGPERALTFSWKKSAQKFLDVVAELEK